MPSFKKMVIEWQGKYRFTGKNEKDLSVKFDAPIANGGEETALSPMENVLASLAACSSYHAITILRKKRQDFSDYSVEITGERRDEPQEYSHASISNTSSKEKTSAKEQ